MWFIGVEVEQDTSAPPPKKNPGSAPVARYVILLIKPLANLKNSWIAYTYFPALGIDPQLNGLFFEF